MRDEHDWSPDLYVSPEHLRARLDTVKASGVRVRPLNEAVEALATGTLHEPCVAFTFDDGFYDFSRHAAPLLLEYGYPATVYLTTYYVDYQRPIFQLIVPYMLWKRRESRTTVGKNLGLKTDVILAPDTWRAIASSVRHYAATRLVSARKLDAFAKIVAAEVGLDYESVVGSRILQLMSPAEVAEAAQAGFDVELHTHRHRTPNNEDLFRRELRDNRERIFRMTGHRPRHFCYPSGVYSGEFLPWLRAEGVETATTCELALAARDDDPLLLPRMLDHTGVSEVEFEAWLSGFEPRLRELCFPARAPV